MKSSEARPGIRYKEGGLNILLFEKGIRKLERFKPIAKDSLGTKPPAAGGLGGLGKIPLADMLFFSEK